MALQKKSQAAKCYHEMLDDSPLSPVVAPRGKYKTDSSEKNKSFFPSILRTINEAISDFSSPVRDAPAPSPSFEECEFIATSAIEKNDPEGLKVSRQMSVYSSGKTPIRESIDPPPDEEIAESSIEVPLDYTPKDSVSVEEITRYSDNAGGCCNVIVDNDDDSFTDEKNYEGDELMPMGRKKNAEQSNEAESYEPFSAVEDVKPGAVAVVKEEIHRDEEVMTTNGDDADTQENYVPEIETLNSDEANQNVEYLNISNNGDLVVLKSPPEPEPELPPQSKIFPASYLSYHDVHKDLFKETKTKLDELSEIVRYVDDWEQIVHKCVVSRYAEYSKIRSGVCHYEKKVDSLVADIEKLKQKNRLVPPKQIDKLERNQIKLEGTRKTHDKNGETLLMFLDEVVLRSWRDAFPLLRKSIISELSFAAVNQEHLVRLGESLAMLDMIGSEESIETEGRLTTFDNCNPEDIYTGVKKDHEEFSFK
jgi:hypothetical protein